MTYKKSWKDNRNLNKTELKKLEKDGLEILNDIEKYAKTGFESIPESEWDLFKWAGLYLQKPKNAGYFMMRVKVPAGLLTYDQTVTLANIAKDYGRGVFDITTRQAVQFHWLTIEQLPDIFKRLEKVGLSSVGACGDIPRNIVGNPLAGIDPNELLDTSSLVKEVDDYFDRNKEFSNLPRKYKVSINASMYNSSNAEINDLAFTPAKKKINGKEKVGFHVKVGGGLSAKPYLAQLLDVFVLPEQVKDVAIAITTIFRDYGYREKRHRARLKFLVADWGSEVFKEKLFEYTGPLPSKGEDMTKGWNAGFIYGVHPQKQEGYRYVGFNVPVGRLYADEVIQIAEAAKKYGNGEIRTCNSQNFLIPYVKDENVESLLQEKIFQGRISTKPHSFTAYSVSCTGIEYCNLALVETKERMKNIASYLDEQLELDVPVRIHMVGCPNSCGQRQIADIGLQGVLMKTKEKKMVEAYELYVGGTLLNGGKFNDKLKGKVLADQLPDVLKGMLQFFKENKRKDETFLRFYQRIGIDPLQEQLNELLESVSV